MPSWKAILDEVKAAGSTFDVVRRKYIKQLAELTGRNVIAYYSGWLQKSDIVSQRFGGFSVDDGDKNGFMAVIHQLDRTKGLDLILHTPGGSTAATESLVDYLRSMFDTNMRAIVPQIAMSAGTMIALACREVVMGKHSSLGPIDPQIGGIPAHGVIEEFERAKREVQSSPGTIPIWQPIIAKYHPTLIGECEKSIKWSKEMVKEWLITGMFAGEADATTKVDRIIEELADHAITLSHARHIAVKKAHDLGIKVMMLEAPQNKDLQDAVLTVHHACIQTLSGTGAFKIIENQNGVGFLQVLAPAVITG
ncbi:MAG: SDH family Clp fold serine proteinase [Phycisphaerae bacterium]